MEPDAATARQINLVIDDSGSMFADSAGKPLTRWSQAKYALEVFAAMLGADDSLNVYRMSDFANGRMAGAVVSLTGADPASSRVAQIHAMQMKGSNTPYAPVRQAYADLAASPTDNKWLVILTDGEFNDRSTADVQKDLRGFVEKNTKGARTLKVAFLAIGNEAPAIVSDPAHGIYFEHAASGDLLTRMTGFANLIFERNLIRQNAPGKIAPDIDLSEVIVFAQGADVSVGDASGTTTVPPSSTVQVSWVENTPVRMGGRSAAPVPDRDLHGELAVYPGIAHGNVSFAVRGAQTVDIFYKPSVKFGIQLRDASGAPVAADKIVGGKYTLRYGFMDADCTLITSPLLGDVTYSARVVRDGKVVVDSFQSGDQIELDRGSVDLQVHARYLGGNTADAKIALTVLQPARPTGFDVTERRFTARGLDGYTPPDGAIALRYGLGAAGKLTDFTADEWAAVTPQSFTVTSSSNIRFTVSLGDQPGQIYLTPHAPGGDVFAADTGRIHVQVKASHVYDEQLYTAQFATTTTVVDDIPWAERAMHWFATVGWKLLLVLIALIILIGYIVKPRFSKKIKRSPSVVGVPMAISLRQENGSGKFRIATGRKLLPFAADVATLRCVPAGVVGFSALRLKAARGGKIQLTNWRQVAQRKNIALNGNDIGEDTRRMPVLSPSTQITATVPQQMRYEMYLNA